MYTIIGGDGKEYGPVTRNQIRAWLADGRANADSRTKALGTDEWRRLGDFSDFSESSDAAGGGVQGLPPPIPSATPGGRPAGPLDVVSCYERSWTLLMANFWPLVGANLLIVSLGFIVDSAISFHDPRPFSALRFIELLFLAAPLNAGRYYYFLRRLRGEPAGMGELFIGFGRGFIPLVIAFVLTLVFCVLGTVCLVLPGIYLAVAYLFVLPLIVDKGMGFWEAMETSRRVITTQWWRIFLLLLLVIPFILLGLIAFLVGVFVTMPICIGALMFAYEDLIGREPGP
jgi:hypothetical protein